MGFPLENFDAIGLWRQTAPVRVRTQGGGPRPKPITLDPRAQLPDGTLLNNAAALKAYLLEKRKDAFAHSIVERLMGYSLGRSLDFGDRDAVDALTQAFMAQNFRLRPLIVDLVASPSFQTK